MPRPRGERRHHVTLQGPGETVPDGEGGWTTVTGPLDPPDWWCSITRASVRDLEGVTSGPPLTSATYLLEGDYHPGVTLQTQIILTPPAPAPARTFYVADVINVEERSVDLQLLCHEVVT